MGFIPAWIQSIRYRWNAREQATVGPKTTPVASILVAPTAPVTPEVPTHAAVPDTASWNIVTFVPPENVDRSVLQVTFTDQLSVAGQ